MRWHTRPITQLVVMFAIMSVVIGAQGAMSASLTGNIQNINVAENRESGLVNVQASGCIDGEDAPLGDTYGMTQAEKDNMLNRWPISGNPHFETYFGYDIFGSKNGRQYTKIPLEGDELINAIAIRDVDGEADPKAENLLGSVFGYTPDKLKSAYKMKYPDGMGVSPHFIHGDYPGVIVPALADTPLMAPNLPQYPIGGGFGAMVVYADARKITLHIGRHEYVNTAFDNSSNCGGGGCRGGYWIYIENICVANKVLAAYRNAYQNFQQNALADKNPIKLPMVRPGQVIGKTTDATGVNVVVVDSGPIVAANDTHFWKAPVRPFSSGTPPVTSPTVPPASTPTNAPPAGSPTVTPVGSPTAAPSSTPSVSPTATPTGPAVTPTPAPSRPVVEVTPPSSGDHLQFVLSFNNNSNSLYTIFAGKSGDQLNNSLLNWNTHGGPNVQSSIDTFRCESSNAKCTFFIYWSEIFPSLNTLEKLYITFNPSSNPPDNTEYHLIPPQ